MASFGAVGRFAVAGWREDILALAVATHDVVLTGVAYQPGSGQKIVLSPADVVLAGVAYQPSAGTRADSAVGSNLVIAAPALDAQAGASSQPAGTALVLSEAQSQPLSGAAASVVPSDVSLDAVAFLEESGVEIDFSIPADLLLVGSVYQPESGATVDLGVASDLVLTAVEFDIPAGNRVDVLTSDLVLADAPYAAYAGVAVDFAAPGVVLGEVSYAPGSGTKATLEVASDIVLTAPATSAQSGARVDVRPDYQTLYAACVGAHSVAGGPYARLPRHLRASPVTLQPLSGASPILVPAELVLDVAAYEIGARRKPVRGQFMFYN